MHVTPTYSYPQVGSIWSSSREEIPSTFAILRVQGLGKILNLLSQPPRLEDIAEIAAQHKERPHAVDDRGLTASKP